MDPLYNSIGTEMKWHISELSVMGLGNFKTKQKFEFSRVNLLFGQNGSGKSTIIMLFKLWSHILGGKDVNSKYFFDNEKDYFGGVDSWAGPDNSDVYLGIKYSLIQTSKKSYVTGLHDELSRINEIKRNHEGYSGVRSYHLSLTLTKEKDEWLIKEFSIYINEEQFFNTKKQGRAYQVKINAFHSLLDYDKNMLFIKDCYVSLKEYKRLRYINDLVAVGLSLSGNNLTAEEVLEHLFEPHERILIHKEDIELFKSHFTKSLSAAELSTVNIQYEITDVSIVNYLDAIKTLEDDLSDYSPLPFYHMNKDYLLFCNSVKSLPQSGLDELEIYPDETFENLGYAKILSRLLEAHLTLSFNKSELFDIYKGFKASLYDVIDGFIEIAKGNTFSMYHVEELRPIPKFNRPLDL